VRRGHSSLSSIALESGRERLLTDAEGLEGLRLSPDARRVAFTYAPGNFFNVGVMSIDGGQPQQLTFESTFTGFPCWSPDGKFVAFQTRRGDDMQIMLMPSDGGTPIQLTFDRGDKWPYSWSPDGDKILFASSRNGVWNIGWISLSDRTGKQITNNTIPGAVIRFPDWSPSGDQILYEHAEIAGNIYVMSLNE
jgi:Tol biopolymer transport system component